MRALDAELPSANGYKGTDHEPVPDYGGLRSVFALQIHRGSVEQPAKVSFGVRGLDEQEALRVLAMLATIRPSMIPLLARGPQAAQESVLVDASRRLAA
ncbi:hypothetical protein [Pendulispora albinea]|uniref:Uncharacterized protein n=1 Tax=Pendulispora albinea TaxID=2741071 RepID=A0ABZ2MAE1_9BACT